MAVSAPALTVGRAFTVIMTLSVAVQPNLSVTVKVYVVLATGFAMGLIMDELLSPAAGIHE